MPASRPDLNADVRVELLDRLLKDFDEDRREGKTMRSLHEKLEKHTIEDDTRFEKLNEKLYETREHMARRSGYQNAVDTGSFHVPPVQVNIEAAKTPSKRPSMLPAGVVKLISDPKIIAAILAAVGVASHVFRSCAIGH